MRIKKNISRRFTACLLGLSMLFGPLILTAQYNSNFQSARTLGQGGVELILGYTNYEGGFDNYIAAAGFGIIDRLDIKLNYQRGLYSFDEWSSGLNYFTLEPKVAILPDYVALSVPFGLWFSEFSERVFVLSPKLHFSYSPIKYFEASFSPKLNIIFWDNEDPSVLVGLNLGFAVSTDIDKWAVRPEAGVMFDPNGGTSIYGGTSINGGSSIWNVGLAASVNLTSFGRTEK